jgi:hypothetical protein
MENDAAEHIRIKVAISLDKLLKRRLAEIDSGVNDEEIALSYNQIALKTDLRKATVSDSFNAKHTMKVTTLISIVDAMGYDLIEFSKVYNSLNIKDIEGFKSSGLN